MPCVLRRRRLTDELGRPSSCGSQPCCSNISGRRCSNPGVSLDSWAPEDPFDDLPFESDSREPQPSMISSHGSHCQETCCWKRVSAGHDFAFPGKVSKNMDAPSKCMMWVWLSPSKSFFSDPKSQDQVSGDRDGRKVTGWRPAVCLQGLPGGPTQWPLSEL